MLLQIELENGTLSGQKFDLSTGFLSIGRGENCSIRFDPFTERIASNQHAFIESRADGYYLIDNKSTNGTFLNGAMMDTAKLSNGDQVQFGKHGIVARVSIGNDLMSSQPALRSPSVISQGSALVPVQSAMPINFQSSISGLGAANISTDPVGGNTKRYLGIGITIFFAAFLILIVAALMFLSVGVGPAVLASVVAFVPAVIYVLPLIWLDRYDPEPFWLLAAAFAWGALVAVFISFVINSIFGVAVGIAISPEAGEALGAIMSAPIFEEGSKGLGLVLLLIFFRRHFDDILDGIVFAGVIALGFATVENVLYYGRAIAESGLGGLAVIFVLRGILSPFAHVSFTAMTGIGCGIARESHNTAVRILLPLLGCIGAITLHAIWNGMAVIGGFEGFLVGYLILEIPFFLIFVGFAAYVMRRQNKILREMLAIDIARGLISEELGATVTSAFRSSGWLISGLFAGKYRGRSNYLRSVGKLGLSYWHIQRATLSQGQTGSFQQNPILRDEVLKWRDQV